jgi:hypothetical protein
MHFSNHVAVLLHRSVNGVAQLCMMVLLSFIAPLAWAQTSFDPPRIHIVYMGGNDCPPCVAWRTGELPKLQQSEAFKAIKFSYVHKSISSPVPAWFFLPTEVKPYKDKLDYASARKSGSPHFAVLVDDEVYDYYFGTRSADDVESMIVAIQKGTKYPYKRCLKLNDKRGCEIMR